MSFTSNIVLGTLAASLTLGAIQFASGSDLARAKSVGTTEHSSIVNRTAKADRYAITKGFEQRSEQTRTISFSVERLADTSVLMRLPVANTSSTTTTNSIGLPKATPIAGRQTVACEPVVSVLTEIAKQLQPGRCVT